MGELRLVEMDPADEPRDVGAKPRDVGAKPWDVGAKMWGMIWIDLDPMTP